MRSKGCTRVKLLFGECALSTVVQVPAVIALTPVASPSLGFASGLTELGTLLTKWMPD
jgi:hypothetical protein